jgi:hypothetical protein
MRAIASALVLLLAPSAAWAGEVYGKILAGQTPVGDAATVEAKCGDKVYPAVATDTSGGYHLVLDSTGKCVLTVKHKTMSAALDIASYDDPVQVDIVLETKDGRLTARRK